MLTIGEMLTINGVKFDGVDGSKLKTGNVKGEMVNVIRCKDCKYYSQVLSGPNEFGSCKYCIYPMPDDFCNHGEPVEKSAETVDNPGGANDGR